VVREEVVEEVLVAVEQAAPVVAVAVEVLGAAEQVAPVVALVFRKV
jgi:hypothetical protein